MRRRDIFLALLIVLAGIAITAHRRGIFHDLAKVERDLSQFVSSHLPQPRGAWRELERIYRQVPRENAASLVIELPTGSVSVKGQPQDEIEIEAVRYHTGGIAGPPGSGFGSSGFIQRAGPSQVRLGVTRDQRGLVVRAIVPQELRQSERLDLSITCPPELKIEAKSLYGSIHVEGMQRLVAATTVSGTVRVDGAGEVKASATSGWVELSNITGPVEASSGEATLQLRGIAGKVTAATTSGRVEGSVLTGPLSISTVSGVINLSNYQGSPAALSSTSGGIWAILSELEPSAAREFTARTVSGQCAIKVAPYSNWAVSLSSQSGEVSSRAPLRNMTQTRGQITGLLGAGRGKLVVRSVSGAVTLEGTTPPEGQSPGMP